MVKPLSYGLSFHEFRPRFALFPIAGTGRIDLARGLVSESFVSRGMAVNISHIKGKGVAIRNHCIHSLERCRDICKATRTKKARLFEFHRSQSTSTNLERLEVWPSHTPLQYGFTMLVHLLFVAMSVSNRENVSN
ncbi:hypothetical protein AVEN_104414-1 [Araneus ventricosus]|uniref:Uncharacterized protein n=1 Tax=Araneus ventricosus TaxID=182803 RepID=A0A4Y2N1K2_ARAVE|nr:hypothetical protein AVEN_104414-1 [Araneus ventricosus]